MSVCMLHVSVCTESHKTISDFDENWKWSLIKINFCDICEQNIIVEGQFFFLTRKNNSIDHLLKFLKEQFDILRNTLLQILVES